MNKLLIAGLGAALLTLAGCATTSTASSASVPWEADESTLPAIPPLEGGDVMATSALPWTADESSLPAIAPADAFTDYDMLPN